MKSTKIKEKIYLLIPRLQKAISGVGGKEAVRISGLKQADLSRWVHNTSTWSFEKILIIAEKFEL